MTGGPEGYAFRRFIQQSIDIIELNWIYAALEFLPLWLFLELPEYYFEAGLGSLGQTEAASYQQLGFVEIYYGDKAQRLHVDFNTQESHFVVYHQPFYRKTDIGEAVAGIVRDYLAEPDQ
ncbi:MAG: hypothetical protein QOH24_2366 [Verrucomicrobiota bacterium]